MTTAVQVQYRRGTASQVATFTGAAGEMVVDTTNNRLVVQDGSTAGGWPMAVASRVAVSDTNYTLSSPYGMVAYTAISAARTVSLPATTSYASGQRLLVIDESGSCSATKTITLSANGSDKIDNASAAIISQPYGYIEIESNGSGKWTISDQGPQVNALNNLTGQLALAATDGMSISASGSTIALGGPGGMVNRFRNGAMDVWQRGTAPSLTSGTSGSQYTADGWQVIWTASSSAAPAISQVGGRLLTKNSLQIAGAANITDVQVQQRIESLIAAVLCSQTVTVQAQVYNNTGGPITPTLTVKRPSTQDGWSGTINTDVSAVALQSCANAAWTQLAYTFNANAAAYNGLEVIFDFGNNFSSSGKDIQIAECDIRVTPAASAGMNSTPPPPELRPVATELALCQRYFQSSFPAGIAPQNSYGSPRVAGYAASTTTAQSIVDFFVPFMTTPSTIAFFSGSGGTSGEWEFLGSGTSGVTSIASSGTAITNTWMAVNVTLSGLTAGSANASQGWWTASAEL
jgi:Major tropism determinant N-terminal domain